ncbi:putative Ig domain-containing protein [Spirosoma sp. KUDC1026]|uniref:putative Ig domain-containing protein n=1 Tax=Spirosoma sp. KUDC1026 TaxID=2745947 RepID=UPI00159BEB41|nr:putative Ig domain-containing protein [Spirosoma sp. KUDC1026]QKZ13103.1 putative Ig domain-containing protein [Spirosoma sp. KUDC1026]
MNQQLRLANFWSWLTAAFLVSFGTAQAQLLTEDFGATTLPYSLTLQGWAAHSGAGTNTINASAPNLTYSGLSTSGGSASLTTSGEDVNRAFTPQTSGSVYASMLVNVSAAQATGDYFFHFGGATIGSTFASRLYVKSATGGFQFGISKTNDAPTYATTPYSFNTTYLVVLKYTIVAGSNNDTAELFIQPVVGQTEPTATVTQTSTTASDLSTVGTIALRQGGGTAAPTVRVDYIRVGTTWSDVTSGTAGPNQAPTVANAIPGQSATVGLPFSYTVPANTFTDPENETLTLTASGLPAGITFTNGTFGGTPTMAGVSSVTVTATDPGNASVSTAFSFTVNPAPTTNQPPTVANAIPNQTAVEGQAFSYTIPANTFSDPNGDVLTLTASGLPAGLTFTNGTVSGAVSTTGVYPITITATDPGSLSISTSFTLTVNSRFTPIAAARLGIGQIFTIMGRVTVTNQLGSRQFYVQDETGGILVYSGASGTDYSGVVQLGDLVQVSGPISVFNGALEVNGVTGFTAVSGGDVPAPKVITLDQLPNYQGQLVRVSDATISGTGATFTGGTNYTITAGGQSGTLRISANSPLANAGRPANPVSVTGISDRFVSGATTAGANGLQLQPRILSDISGATAATDQLCGGTGGTELNRDQTLDIAAWNMEFFGANAGVIACPQGNLPYNNFGPTNEELQQTNATTVLGKLSADIIAVEEVSDINRLQAAVAAIPGSYSYICSNRFSYYFQNECDQTPSNGTVFGPTSLAQKVCVVYNTATVTPILAETKPLLDGKYNYPADNNWSSGRLPFMFVANVTINGITRKIHTVAIHAKSGSAVADYNRRKQDIDDLKAELDANYSTENLVILGDYNDQINTSIAAGRPSSYTSIIADATNYSVLTQPLETQGCNTFASSASFIDHLTVSNELNAAYVGNSAYVLQPGTIPNYVNTTSDHYPIAARFNLASLVGPVTPLALTLTAVPTQVTAAGSVNLLATVTGGTAPFSYTFSGPGTITVSGNSATITGLPTGLQTFTVTVADATTPTPQTITQTASVSVSANPTAPFAITGVTTISCATLTAGSRQLTFTPQYTGLTGQPVTFAVQNELSPTTSAGPYSLRLYTDNPVVTLRASQAGTETSFVYNWLAICNGTTPPASQPLALTLTAVPTQVTATGSVNLLATVTGGTAPFSYTFSGPGTITVSGNSATVTGLPTGLQTFTVTVADATSPTRQTITQTASVSVSATSTAPFAITGVTTISCATLTAGSRQLTFTPQYTGLTGQPVTFAVQNELSPTTSAGPYSLRLYTDNPVVTLRASQAGTETSFVYNWLAACNGTTPPVNQPLALTLTAVPTQVTAAGSVNLLATVTGGTAPFSYTFSGPGTITVSGNSATVTGLPTGLQTFTVTVADATTPTPQTITQTASVSVSANPTAPFAITGVTTISCATLTAGSRQLTFTPQYTGLTGQPVTFAVQNELSPTTSAGPYSLRLYTDNPVVTLRASQAGTETSFVYNWLAACSTPNARVAVKEETLQVNLLGNPSANGQVSVEVRGAVDQVLHLQLTDMSGRVIDTRQIEQAGSVERHTFDVNRQQRGILLLRATTPTQAQTVKVIKAD